MNCPPCGNTVSAAEDKALKTFEISPMYTIDSRRASFQGNRSLKNSSF
jgi:hypothetical protein